MVKTAVVELRQPGVVTKEVVSTSFSFYDAGEAEKISVKKISNPVLFDALNNPVTDGLYDPALGPIDPHGSCATCRLGALHCPGHFGHIDLNVAVYNPLTFGTVLRLLRAACLHCGRFKLAGDRVAAFATRLRLIRAGDLEAAAAVSTVGVSKSVRGELRAMEEEAGEMDVDDEEAARVAENVSGRVDAKEPRETGRPRWTAHAMAEARDLVRDFLGSVPSKCENCGCASPKIAPEGATRLYRHALNGKQREVNAALGVDLEAELEALARRGSGTDGAELAGKEVEEGDEDTAEKGADAKKKKKKKRRRKSKAGSDDDDESGDDPDAGSDSDADSDGDSDSDSDGSDAPRKTPKTKADESSPNEANAAAASKKFLITTDEALGLLERLWAREYDFCAMVWVASAAPGKASSAFSESGDPLQTRHSNPARFFMKKVLVTPCRLRPPSRMGDMMFEHPQNVHLGAIIQANLTLAELFRKPPTVPEPESTRTQRMLRAFMTLQAGVNRLIDSSKAEGGDANGIGIRQQLEKKQGLFRMNMMGKRVNYAARSVIMPDPYIRTSEIGVPPVFAKKLTFPEHVTAHNIDLMRRLVENGADEHPGANAIEDERGRVIHLERFTREKRAAIAKTLLATPGAATDTESARAAGIPVEDGDERKASRGKHIKLGDGDDDAKKEGGVSKTETSLAADAARAAAAPAPRPLAKKVYRHLRDGDVLLVNRQPTLHKPGIMAHTARVLRGQRTIRMHYANCSTYNADFDGDEMNMHFPQDHLGRAEAYEIVRADQQYTVPTDGKPLRGLIQDHVCAGVLLTKRDTFLTKAQFQQLAYLALVDLVGGEGGRGGGSAAAASLRTPRPAVLKPVPLWTGKQVVGSVLQHVTAGRAPLTHDAGAKVPANYWGGDESGEGAFVVRRNYVCAGVLDKNLFGKHGLVHAVAELHGRVLAGDFISVLSRLLTAHLQHRGMTCGMDDLLLKPESEAGRRERLAEATGACRGAAAAFAEADANAPDAALREQIASRLSEREGAEAALDMRSSGALNKVTSATVGQCLPHGTKKPFPRNCLSLMTQSGAKGSMVNFSQIAACLGQQELEGRRVPRMTSGKTLPCFTPHDVSERAGGYIRDRFFSGLRPQEYFFHCMAGREGLVDTAVKTSRSGYLQRCLVKNLEALRVHYDHTVRDCDGAVVQFQYGDDAVDVTRGGCLSQFKFLAENPELVRANLESARRAAGATTSATAADGARTDRTVALRHLPDDASLSRASGKPETPLTATHAAGSTVGVVPEKFADDLDAFLAATHPDYFAPEIALSGSAATEKKKPKKTKKTKEPPSSSPSRTTLARDAGVSRTEFETLMRLRFLASLAVPGEAVGCVAAQSVGEPSTQMTLNTFHFAGRGEANVTLGIPRLRELLMAASKKLATPVMTLPLREAYADDVEAARRLARRLRRVRLAELVKKLTVEETACGRSHGGSGALARTYRVRVELRGDEDAEDASDSEEDASDSEEDGDATEASSGRVRFAQAARAFKREFAKRLVGEIKLELRRRGAGAGRIHAGREEGTRTGAGPRDAAAAAADADADADASASRRAAAAAAAAEDGEDGDDSDDDGAEDEEGAKTEGRRGARGDGGEKYTEKGADETRAGKKDDDDDDGGRAATATAAEIGSGRGEERREDARDATSSSGSGSDDAMATSSDSDSDADSDADSAGTSPTTATRKKPPAAKPKPKSRLGRGSALLESLEEICESISVDRASRACELHLSLALGAPRLLMLEMAEQVAAATIVRATKGIDKTFVIGKPSSEDPTGKSPLCVQTDGVNFAAAWANDDLVRCADVKTNDVYAMLTTYGVEAARQTLVAEVKGVFAVYGIGVDARHLSLIGDFMMQQGDYRPCSRAGMETSTSPLLKMSFETAAAFLVDATLKGTVDELDSPSAKIVLGQVVEMGTGSFGLRFDVDKAAAMRGDMKTETY